MHKKWIVANWKANPTSVAEARELISSLAETISALPNKETVGMVICPPFVFLEEISGMIQKSPIEGSVVLGAQDIASSDSTSQTGEITGTELSKLGVRYVIVGHSDRRWKLGETDEQIHTKLKAALRDNLTPIFCMGERVRGDQQRELDTQLKALIAHTSEEERSRVIIAYEPVWAISSTPGAEADTSESASQAGEYIVGNLNGKPAAMLYGGSVTAANVESLLSKNIFDGVLVGGASVRRDEFAAIIIRAFKGS